MDSDLEMNEEQMRTVWLLRVAWGMDALCRRNQEALMTGSGFPLRWAYEKLRWKLEHRYPEPVPADLDTYVKAIRRLQG